ncbi:hypothetical protein SAMN04487852_104184 [Prevotella sp. tf2-5]|nr:hypothetical protein SAMN04487852_104184 [Prevotella sp. tf2-5]
MFFQFFVYFCNLAKNRSIFYLKIGLLKSVGTIFVYLWQKSNLSLGGLLSLRVPLGSYSVPSEQEIYIIAGR